MTSRSDTPRSLDLFDVHESGQLRLTVAGEQVSLLALPDEWIPLTDEPQAVDELAVHG